MTIRPIVLPDVDSDLLAIGHQLEELLLVLGDGRLDPGDVDLDGPWAVLAGRQGLGWLLAAFDDSLALTLYGPDGRYEHEQLRAVDVDSELATTRLAPGDVGDRRVSHDQRRRGRDGGPASRHVRPGLERRSHRTGRPARGGSRQPAARRP